MKTINILILAVLFFTPSCIAKEKGVVSQEIESDTSSEAMEKMLERYGTPSHQNPTKEEAAYYRGSLEATLNSLFTELKTLRALPAEGTEEAHRILLISVLVDASSLKQSVRIANPQEETMDQVKRVSKEILLYLHNNRKELAQKKWAGLRETAIQHTLASIKDFLTEEKDIDTWESLCLSFYSTTDLQLPIHMR